VDPVTLFGIDVSNYQAGIDLGAACAEGVEFVIAKTTQGGGYRSPAWPEQRDGARKVGMLLAGYHYVTADPAGAQAANCAGWLGDRSIGVALDWEAPGVTPARFAEVLDAFRAAGVAVVLAYVPRWYWAQVGSPDLRQFGVPLWSSRYPTRAAGLPSSIYAGITDATRAGGWTGYGGRDVALWQFTDRASVANRQVDANAYRGTRAELAALFCPAPSTPPPPAPGGLGADEESHVLITTPLPLDGLPKQQWPAERISIGFDPSGGWRGRVVLKAHWSYPGGWIHEAKWWVRHPSANGLGSPNEPHDAVPIDFGADAERFVGLGLEISPPDRADELELVLSAPGGVHLFPFYEH
jgi:hypothetical protein